MASSAKLGVVNSNKSAPFESLSGPGIAQIGAKKQVASEVVLQLQKVGIELSGNHHVFEGQRNFVTDCTAKLQEGPLY